MGEVLPPGHAERELDGRKVIARFVAVAIRMPRYARLGWLLVNDPHVSGYGKVVLGGALGYVLSPIDAVPGLIPVLGQMDDMAVLILAVRTALRAAAPDVAAAHLQTAGLTWETIDGDVLTLRATAAWVARRGSKLAMQLGKAVTRTVLRQVTNAVQRRTNSDAARRSTGT
ncbi:MAG: DUF1232 domain-containing protein [Chloroflexi bacterium]|nr:DUF1232 domain-containing protein [Chloroflexota bacterium]